MNTAHNSIKKFLIKCVIKTLKNCPWILISFFSSILAFILSLILKREQRIAYTQLKYALPKINSQTIYRQSIYSAILTVTEGFRIKEILSNPEKTYKFSESINRSKKKLGKAQVNNLEILHEVSDLNEGAVCLSSHTGNFELMAAFFSLQGWPMTVIARKANDPTLSQVLTEIREGYGLEMLWRDDPGTSRLLMSAIRKNRYICALIDQDIGLENEFAPFFGLDAAHPVGPIQIAVRFKKPVLTFLTHRLPNGEHSINIQRIDWEDKASPISYILCNYALQLEEHIKKHPGQWVWWHRRWRRRPGYDYIKNPEQLPSTSKYLEWLSKQPRF